jgi:hypothetical protein
VHGGGQIGLGIAGTAIGRYLALSVLKRIERFVGMEHRAALDVTTENGAQIGAALAAELIERGYQVRLQAGCGAPIMLYLLAARTPQSTYRPEVLRHANRQGALVEVMRSGASCPATCRHDAGVAALLYSRHNPRPPRAAATRAARPQRRRASSRSGLACAASARDSSATDPRYG